MTAPQQTDKDTGNEDVGAPEITDESARPWIQHAFGQEWPDIPQHIVPDLQPSADDEAIAQRLLTAYANCRRDLANQIPIGDDLWSAIGRFQSNFFSVLEAADPRALAAYLCNMARQDATIGITQGSGEYAWITGSADYARFRALLIKDKLISFAEATGAISPENPEQGPWGEILYADPDSLFRRIEEALGLSLAPPPIDGGLFKLPVADTLIHDRDLHAQFAAWSIRGFAGDGARVLEIGGGVGRAAYWGVRMGLGHYTLVDLPHIAVLQGYYLLKALPKHRIQLYGESVPEAVASVLPHFAIGSISAGEIDVVFNQDSLPEIHRDWALRYIARAREIAPKWFCSINQEAGEPYGQEFGVPPTPEDPRQNIVGDLVREVGGFHRFVRAPYWLRKGYAFELYRPAG